MNFKRELRKRFKATERGGGNLTGRESSIMSIAESIYNEALLELKKDAVKKPNPLHSPCRKAFEDFYEKIVDNTGFYFTPKEARNLKLLIDKLRFKIGERSRDTISVDDFVSLFTKFVIGSYEVSKTERAFSYVRDHFTITQLNSNFNELFTKVKGKYDSEKRVIDEYTKDLYQDSEKGQGADGII